ncbi:uncharacterized protein Z520_11204 [Fonsecaea multimorphosa CBS 102226]|uniref:Ubiquinol-cytochrome c chaperone domain-containing protein n=1 Tax=Fonsecaea multimorphosa CBS 102226 TaxID=1442371 RepID=A0A0D2JIX4_9EURO|nr:uncharacterized protein Z520_11204 [Fonsecaea multimorphosa CBS 102226]KIX93147.1 hypothetical protein Z520_11204 [Fonsecaea multimorphosa CBS 102226]OAL18347.1 hypothetical protein AYO22_10763 [Fonsecaea multimorphosa]
MSTFSICSQCLRALRQSVRTESNVRCTPSSSPSTSNGSLTKVTAQTSRIQSSSVSRRRYLSVASSKWQQEAPRSGSQAPLAESLPPTTAPTVTSNVTASFPTTEPQSKSKSEPPPERKDKSSAQPPSPSAGVNVSQMQRQIQSHLSNPPSKSIPARLAESLKKNIPAATRTYTIYGQTEAIFKSCAAPADYTIPQDQRMNILTGKGPPKAAAQEGAELGQPLSENKDSWWFSTVDLPPTFSTWSQVTFLHMYVIVTHLRASLESEAEFQDFHRYLIEHFSRAAEDKMILLHNLAAQGMRSRYLKDLFLQYRGILASYDEGLVKGDAVLASAIWRNLFRADEQVDWEKVSLVVAYLRRAVRRAGLLTLDDLLGSLQKQTGVWGFTQHQQERVQQLVAETSKGVNEAL